MTTSAAARSSTAGLALGHRLFFVDWARAAAYVLMVVAHVAPSDGPGRVLLLSEFLTAPLFALLVGVSAQLSHDRAATHWQGRLPRELLRALFVLVLGLLLAQFATTVVIVLMHLAVLMVLCFPLAHCRTSSLSVIGAAVVVAAVIVPAAHQHLSLVAGPPGLVEMLGLLGGDGPYRLSGLLLCAVLGMLVIRLLPEAGAGSWIAGMAASAAAFVVMAALIIAPNLLGLFGVHAYDGTPPEQLGVAAGAVGVLLGFWALEHMPLVRALDPAALRLAAAPGQMALTLYTLQIVVLQIYQAARPGTRDDHWWMLALLVVLGLLCAGLWQIVLTALARRSPSLRRWTGGPLEGLCRLVQDVAVSADASTRSVPSGSHRS